MLRVSDRVSDGPAVLVDLVVISSFRALISEEMDVLVIDARKILAGVLLRLQMLDTESLVPAVREDVERYLTTDRVTMSCIRYSRRIKVCWGRMEERLT